MDKSYRASIVAHKVSLDALVAPTSIHKNLFYEIHELADASALMDSPIDVQNVWQAKAFADAKFVESLQNKLSATQT